MVNVTFSRFIFCFVYLILCMTKKDFGKNEEGRIDDARFKTNKKEEMKMLIDRTGNWLTGIHDSFGSRYG